MKWFQAPIKDEAHRLVIHVEQFGYKAYLRTQQEHFGVADGLEAQLFTGSKHAMRYLQKLFVISDVTINLSGSSDENLQKYFLLPPGRSCGAIRCGSLLCGLNCDWRGI